MNKIESLDTGEAASCELVERALKFIIEDTVGRLRSTLIGMENCRDITRAEHDWLLAHRQALAELLERGAM